MRVEHKDKVEIAERYEKISRFKEKIFVGHRRWEGLYVIHVRDILRPGTGRTSFRLVLLHNVAL
jgi:hypothetical protein